MPLAAPIQVRLEREMLAEIRVEAAAKGCSISDVVRARLSPFAKIDREFQGLRSELALWVARPASHTPDDRVYDALQRLMGMNAEMLGAMRRHNSVNTTNARADVEQAGLPIWGRRKVER